MCHNVMPRLTTSKVIRIAKIPALLMMMTFFGAKRWDDLPLAAQNYLKRLEELTGVPVAIVSTGPERDETIVRVHPFA